MDGFLRDLALLLIGAFIAPIVMRVVRIPSRMKELYRATDRAWTDHRLFVERNYRRMLRELRTVDEEMNSRGLYDSGIRLVKRAELIETYQDALEDNWRSTIRRIEDAGTFVGWLEKVYFKRRLENKTETRSVENQLIEGAKDLAEQELSSETDRLGQEK